MIQPISRDLLKTTIATHSQHFNPYQFIVLPTNLIGTPRYEGHTLTLDPHNLPAGIQFCILGWIMLLANTPIRFTHPAYLFDYPDQYPDYFAYCAHLLGTTLANTITMAFMDNWPDHLYTAYHQARATQDLQALGQVIGLVIDHYLDNPVDAYPDPPQPAT